MSNLMKYKLDLDFIAFVFIKLNDYVTMTSWCLRCVTKYVT